MKTKIIIIIALFTLNISLVSARTNSPKGADGPSKSEFSVSLTLLAPSTPPEATFEDATEVNSLNALLSSIAPVTPKVASFEDNPTGQENPGIGSLPVNPKPETPAKGKRIHPSFPPPCNEKYGCSL